jgi:lipid II:glycine glycyltransferase (peptidoglycan interpeptide bridge formation enzyme)
MEPPGRSFPEIGGTAVADVTHLLELAGRDADTLWSGFRRAIRRDVRKAERAAVEVRNAVDSEAVDTFFELYLAAMERNLAPAKYPRAFVQAIADEFVRPGRGAILVAYREGRALAGMVLVDSSAGSHYLLAGSHTWGLQHSPNDLLVWRALERSVALGHRWFDFLPSGAGDAALQRFKAKWGSEAVSASTRDLVQRPAAIAAWNLALRAAGWEPVRRTLSRIRSAREARPPGAT